MDHTYASRQNVKEAENSTTNKNIDIVDEPSTSGLNLPARRNLTIQETMHYDEPSTSGLISPAGRNFTTQETIHLVDEPSTSRLYFPAGRNLTTLKNIEIVDVPSISGLKLPAGRNFTTQKITDIVDQPSTYGLSLQAGENYTTHKNIERMDQSSTSGLNLQAGDSTTTHRNVDVMVQPAKPGIKEKLAKCSLSSAQHFNTPTMSTTQTEVKSRIPVAVRKSKKVDRFAETDHFQLQPRLCDTIQEIPEPMPEMSPDEEEEEYEMQMSKVGDIQIFHGRFTKYYEQMRDLDQSLYETFGMATEYERLNQQLIGFLGELCYYREKRE